MYIIFMESSTFIELGTEVNLDPIDYLITTPLLLFNQTACVDDTTTTAGVGIVVNNSFDGTTFESSAWEVH